MPTFNREVVRILQANCQTCHREDGIAPFPLVTYEDVSQRALQVVAMTAARIMPPWKAVEGCGDFQGVRRLSSDQIATFAAWLQAGKPEGDPADLPPPLTFSDEWKLGTPDLVLTMPQAYSAETDQDQFRMIPLPYIFEKDMYVTGIDVRSSSRHNVHHVVVYLDATRESDQHDAEDPLAGYDLTQFPNHTGFNAAGVLTAWLPGMHPRTLPAHTAMRIPAGCKIVMEVHYHPHDGHIDPDRTSVGLTFARETIHKLVNYGSADNLNFMIPAGARDYRGLSTLIYDRDSHLLGVQGHMHYLGRYLRVHLIRPDGTRECLLQIDDWDRLWQMFFVYKEPIAIPAHSRVELECFYDNTSDNWRNPYNPPRDVPYGGRAYQEMCTLLQTFTYDDEELNIEP